MGQTAEVLEASVQQVCPDAQLVEWASMPEGEYRAFTVGSLFGRDRLECAGRMHMMHAAPDYRWQADASLLEGFKHLAVPACTVRRRDGQAGKCAVQRPLHLLNSDSTLMRTCCLDDRHCTAVALCPYMTRLRTKP